MMHQLSKLIMILGIVALGYPAHGEPLPKYIPYRYKDKWGYCDSHKKVLIAPQWDEVYFFYDDRAVVRTGATHCVIDTNGHYIIPPERHWNGIRRPGIENSALNSYDSTGRWGFIDADNRVIIPFLYDAPSPEAYYRWADWFMHWGNTTYYVAGKGGKKGLIDGHGRVLIPFEYDALLDSCREYSFQKNESPVYFYARKNGKTGIVDTTGKVVIPVLFNRVNYLNDHGCAIASNDTGTGAVDLHGNILVPLKYDNVTWYDGSKDSLIAFFVSKHQKQGWIDYTSHLTIEPRWDGLQRNEDSTFTVSLKRKYGLLAPDGAQLLPCKYDMITVTADSILVRYTSKDKYTDSMVEHTTWYDKEGKKLALPWKLRKYYTPSITTDFLNNFGLHPGDWEGHSDYLDNLIPKPVFIRRDGQDIYTFRKDSLTFKLDGTLILDADSDGRRGWYYIASAGRPTGKELQEPMINPPIPPGTVDKYYAVLDTGLNYIIPPEDRYELKNVQRYGIMHGNAVIARQSGMYGVIDNNLNVLVDFQAAIIGDYFKSDKKWYALTTPTREVISYNHMESNGPISLINEKGKAQPGFAGYTIDHMADKWGRNTDRKFNGFFMVKDSFQRMGIVDIEGHVVFPEISFKYSYIDGTGGGNFLKACTDAWLAPCHLFVNSHDEQIFNDVRIIGNESIGSITFGQIFNERGNIIYTTYPLTKVLITDPVSRVYSYFYMDDNGTVYADGLDVK